MPQTATANRWSSQLCRQKRQEPIGNRLAVSVLATGLILLTWDALCAQADYRLLFTIESPRGEEAAVDRFGEDVKVVGNNIVVGAKNDDTAAISAGAAYIFDRNGKLIRPILNPSAVFGDGFGETIVPIDDRRMLIIDLAQFSTDSSSVFLMDDEANLLHTFFHPRQEPSTFFGRAAASNGTHVLITAADDSLAAPLAGAAYLFDLEGNLLQTYVSPQAAFNGSFGRAAMFVGDDRVLISDRLDDTGAENAGAAFLFDLQGNLLHTFFNPTPAQSEFFGTGTGLAMVGDQILIGASQESSLEEYSGAAYLFSQEGELQLTVLDPEPSFENWFGWSVAAVDEKHFMVGSIFNDELGINSGKAYLYNTDGELLFTFTSPQPHMGQHFGRAFAVQEEDILISENAAGVGSTQFGAVHMFQPVSIDGDANLDGTVDLADFNVLKQNFGSGDRFRHGDFDRDLDVDLNDFNIIKENFGNSQPVPEPHTQVLAIAAVIAFSVWQFLKRLNGWRGFRTAGGAQP